MVQVAKQIVWFRDLGVVEYQEAWDYQEKILRENIALKFAHAEAAATQSFAQNLVPGTLDASPYSEQATPGTPDTSYTQHATPDTLHSAPYTLHPKPYTRNPKLYTRNPKPYTLHPTPETQNYLLFVEHPPVYTLGKSGSEENVLIDEEERRAKGISFYKTNRGGDITFHGYDQIVGYPILDLEKFTTDIGKYLRNLEEVIILTMAEYGIKGERSPGETGVWIDAAIPGKERKICAMGIRCSRWITMHGFAFNVNTDLSYFNHIIPCGIQNKQVTSLEKELGYKPDIQEVKGKIKRNFEKVFDVQIREE